MIIIFRTKKMYIHIKKECEIKMPKILKELIPYIIIIVVVVIIRTFIVTPVIVDGESMNPTLENGQVLLLNKYVKEYKRFDIVVIDFDNGTLKDKLIKRIIGLPGEEVKYVNGNLYVDNKIVKDARASFTNDFNISVLGSMKIPEDKYLVLGDNRNNSVDSRMLGFIDKKNIKGITKIRLFEFNKIGKID